MMKEPKESVKTLNIGHELRKMLKEPKCQESFKTANYGNELRKLMKEPTPSITTVDAGRELR